MEARLLPSSEAEDDKEEDVESEASAGTSDCSVLEEGLALMWTVIEKPSNAKKGYNGGWGGAKTKTVKKAAVSM